MKRTTLIAVLAAVAVALVATDGALAKAGKPKRHAGGIAQRHARTASHARAGELRAVTPPECANQGENTHYDYYRSCDDDSVVPAPDPAPPTPPIAEKPALPPTDNTCYEYYADCG